MMTFENVFFELNVCFMDFIPSNEHLTFSQVVFLGFIYLRILFEASNLISDGSELLVLVPSLSKIVGSIILPIVGVVPDGIMILLSGLGENAQTEVAVGMGALAGSTVMLLTVAWFSVILGGRVSLNSSGEPAYKPEPASTGDWQKLADADVKSLTKAAVSCDKAIANSARFMLITAASYIVMELGASAGFGRWTAGVLTLVCIVGLFIYMRKEIKGELAEVMVAQKRVDAILSRVISFRGAMEDLLRVKAFKQGLSESFLGASEVKKQFERVLKYFFNKFDVNKDGSIDYQEFTQVMADLNEHIPPQDLFEIFLSMDTDCSGKIDFDEFVVMIEKLTMHAFPEHSMSTSSRSSSSGDAGDEVVPDDLTCLPAEEQQRRVKQRAGWMMVFGSVLILIFTGPAVDVISNLGVRLDVSPFYLAFVFAPIASNASELIAAYNYACKKTKKSTAVAFSSLIGAAVMNNTFGLAIFFGLVFARGLEWTFHAEVAAILLVQLGVGLYAYFKRSQNLRDGLIILSLYPLSLVLCCVFKTTSN